jgi:hypothetical protein
MAVSEQVLAGADHAGGPHREFVEELRRYFRAAGRPSLRQVSRAIEGRADLREVTASQETVRRMLKGMVLPTDWDPPDGSLTPLAVRLLLKPRYGKVRGAGQPTTLRCRHVPHRRHGVHRHRDHGARGRRDLHGRLRGPRSASNF